MNCVVQVSTIRKHLADVYEKQQMWTEAAKTLIGIPLDGHRNVTTDYKVDIYLKIAMVCTTTYLVCLVLIFAMTFFVILSQLYLEDDNPVDAEAYVNRAAAFQAQASDAILQLKYKACYARVLDAKRRFIEAAQRYYELSTVVSEAERGVTISLAINCTILAGAGMQRSRLLATLYKVCLRKCSCCSPSSLLHFVSFFLLSITLFLPPSLLSLSIIIIPLCFSLSLSFSFFILCVSLFFSLYRFVFLSLSITLFLSFYHFVSVSITLFFCLYHFVFLSLLLSLSLSRSLCITFFFRLFFSNQNGLI